MEKNFIHSAAIVETELIGKNTRVWAFTHILAGAVVGEDCNLCDYVFIENDVVVGNNVTVKCGVQLWDGITLEDNVFIGPNVTFTNDAFPRSKQYPEKYLRTVIKKGASIGANATILPGLTIGQHAMVGAGTVVIKNVPPFAIVVGNPAQIVGYVQANKYTDDNKTYIKEKQLINSETKVKNVKLIDLPIIEDIRGGLTFAEYDHLLPFIPKRFFLVFDVPSKEVRGEHAHHKCKQFLVCVKGCCSVAVDDGQNRIEFLLNRPNLGLLIPEMVWATEYKYSADAILLVLASEIYEETDYIRDYEQYIEELTNQ